MRIMKTIAACILFLVAPLVAQRFVTRAPTVAASGPVFEASAGYTYLVLDTPSRQHVGLSGVDTNGFLDFNARWGMMVDSSYARVEVKKPIGIHSAKANGYLDFNARCGMMVDSSYSRAAHVLGPGHR